MADDEAPERPSKSQRKRDAHALQNLGERLVGLRDAELEGLQLPERLLDAILEARRIRARGGAARQRQYIGKLMRDIDPAPIEAALNAKGEQSARELQRFKRLEQWRERLLREGAAALAELETWRPGLDRTHWLRLIATARSERDRQAQPGSGAAGRALFRALRELFEDAPNEGAPGTMPR